MFVQYFSNQWFRGVRNPTQSAFWVLQSQLLLLEASAINQGRQINLFRRWENSKPRDRTSTTQMEIIQLYGNTDPEISTILSENDRKSRFSNLLVRQIVLYNDTIAI